MADCTSVRLFVYDVSKGMAKNLSSSLLGIQLEGIWHTGVVIFNEEYFFGTMGIQMCHPKDNSPNMQAFATAWHLKKPKES